MSIVLTDDLKENMVLAEDVIETGGRLLLSKGSKVTSNHINIIRKWRIAEVAIGDDNHSQDSAEPTGEEKTVDPMAQNNSPQAGKNHETSFKNKALQTVVDTWCKIQVLSCCTIKALLPHQRDYSPPTTRNIVNSCSKSLGL